MRTEHRTLLVAGTIALLAGCLATVVQVAAADPVATAGECPPCPCSVDEVEQALAAITRAEQVTEELTESPSAVHVEE